MSPLGGDGWTGLDGQDRLKPRYRMVAISRPPANDDNQQLVLRLLFFS